MNDYNTIHEVIEGMEVPVALPEEVIENNLIFEYAYFPYVGNNVIVCPGYPKREEDTYPIPEAINIGLGALWASCNLGASKPSDYGKYFAWGEVNPKKSYTIDNYNFDPSIGELSNEFDAAHVHLGDDWYMPTAADVAELVSTQSNANYEWTWKEIDGHAGVEIKFLPTGNSIFLPAAGSYEGKNNENINLTTQYWSSELGDDGNEEYAAGFSGSRDGHYLDYMSKWNGLSIRPVMHPMS